MEGSELDDLQPVVRDRGVTSLFVVFGVLVLHAGRCLERLDSTAHVTYNDARCLLHIRSSVANRGTKSSNL